MASVKNIIIRGGSVGGGSRALTCWRKYGQLQELQSSAVRTRWTPCVRIEGTHRHWPSCGQDRRYGS